MTSMITSYLAYKMTMEIISTIIGGILLLILLFARK